jgi:serine/threonine protein kinase
LSRLTLYELVTLRPAYEAGSPAEILRAVATSKPPAPKKIAPNLPRDLSTIIEKAIARDPGNRYQHIGEFRDDLLAFVEDRSISARPLGEHGKAISLESAQPVGAGLSTVSLCLLILVAIFGFDRLPYHDGGAGQRKARETGG